MVTILSQLILKGVNAMTYNTTITREHRLLNGDDVEIEIPVSIEYLIDSNHHVIIDCAIDTETGNEIKLTNDERSVMIFDIAKISKE